jgi:galactose-1-phosphate uridylyltransferase
MEIIPKLTIIAGLEMATGTYINISKPEEAAQFLRE